MRTYLYVLLLLIGISFVACTKLNENNLGQTQAAARIIHTLPIPSPTAPSSPSTVPTQLATVTSTPVATVTDILEITQTPTASETISASPDFAPILVAAMELDPYRHSFLPENVWWSEDSHTLYYQDIETQEAWAYDVSTSTSASIAYVPRSFHELESQIQASLPENASLVSLSPYNNLVLYRMPLAEPIPIPDDPFLNPTPEFKVPNSYTAELWLRKDGQDFKLGLVDTCFALLSSPLWSTNENIVIVNGVSTDGIACLHPVWLIDLESLSLGPIDAPWIENYSVLDLSVNGNEFLVRSYIERLNYLFDSTTNERWSIPVDDTDRMILVDACQSPHCLVFDLEFSETILRDHVWYCEPKTGEIKLLTTVEGKISQGVVSPDQKFVSLIVGNEFLPGITYENIVPGLWLMALP